MRKLAAFSQVSLDGYFADVNGDISWLNKGAKDAEFDAFVEDNASAGGLLLFGRITYEMMTSYWPTPYAIDNNPGPASLIATDVPRSVTGNSLQQGATNQAIVRFTLHAPILLCCDQCGRRLPLDIEQEARLLASVHRLPALLLDFKGSRQHGSTLLAVAVAQQPLRDDDAQ